MEAKAVSLDKSVNLNFPKERAKPIVRSQNALGEHTKLIFGQS